MTRTGHIALGLTLAAACGCAGGEPARAPSGSSAGGAASASSREAELDRVAAIHGEAGPYAVAGYRIGQRALRELALGRGARALAVRHESPDQVRWSCMVDGLQASTGASLGRLNLERVSVADPSQTRTVVVHREDGRALVFRLTESFERRFVDVTPQNARALGAEVLELADDEIFEIVDAAESSGPGHGGAGHGGAGHGGAGHGGAGHGAGHGGPAHDHEPSSEEPRR